MIEADNRSPRKVWYDEAFLPFYARFAPLVIMICLLISIGAGVGTYFTQRAQDAETEARQKTTATLLGCFDTYADRFSNTSKEVREAQVHTDAVESRTDQVAARREDAFQELLTLFLRKPPPTKAESIAAFKKLQRTTAALADARGRLVQARNNLAATRAAHPIPDPPSRFCEIPQ
jgi:hypothetical protein